MNEVVLRVARKLLPSHSVSMRFRWPLLVLLSALAWPSGHAAPCYRITDLGVLEGDETSSAAAVNAHGAIVGASLNADGESHAFVFRNGDLTALGTLGGKDSYASDINGRGQIVGAAQLAPPGKAMHAFLYERGRMIDLGDLGGLYSAAYGINDRGVISGYSDIKHSALSPAFIRKKGRLRDLNGLVRRPGGIFLASGSAINARGDIVGYTDTPGRNRQHAFLFSRGKAFDLGTLGGSFSMASDINDHGLIVGDSTLPNAASAPTNAFLDPSPQPAPDHAFLYKNGRMIDLGTLGGRDSMATAINNHGDVVGGADTKGKPSQSRGFLYFAGKMHDLNDMVARSSGWTITWAADINDSRQIAATGIDRAGRRRALRLDPIYVVTRNGPAIRRTRQFSIVLRGRASAEATRVVYRVGRRASRTAQGSATWRFHARLSARTTHIRIVAQGPEGESLPLMVQIVRRTR